MTSRDRLSALVLLALVGLVLAGLEAVEPYYFLRDDNASFFLPSYVFNAESLFERHALAHVNPHQYLGHAHLAVGQTGVLYPPAYLAAAVTGLVRGDPRPLVDVLAALHLLIAALGMFALLRRLGLGRPAAVLGSLLWTTFPFLLIVSRSWIFVSYAAAYLPWGLVLLERLLERPAASRVLALAAVKALFFYQGYVQYVALATLFEAVYLVLRLGGGERSETLSRNRGRWRPAIAYAAVLVATALLAAPLLLPMLHAKQISAYRAGGLSYEELVSNALEVGTFLEAQVFRFEPGAVHLSSGAIFFVGLPNLLVLVVLWRRRDPRRFLAAAITALLAFVFATEAYGATYGVPLLSSFRWPFKSFVIALFYGSVACAGAYDTLLGARRRTARVVAAAMLVAGIAINVALAASSRTHAAFGPNHLSAGVDELRASTAARFPADAGRVVSLWLSPGHPGIERFLVFDYATLAGAHHLGGYDPLVARETLDLALGLEYSNIFRWELSTEMLDYLSSWSVRFLLVPENDSLQAVLEGFPQLRLAHRDGGVEVWENAAALPFAFFGGDDDITAREVEWTARGVRVHTAGRGGLLRVTVAPLTWQEWSADGEDMGAVGYDEARRVAVEVPAGTREVEIRYVDVPFRAGVGIFAGFVLSVTATLLYRKRRSR
ncbi:MAG: hypothetical protein V3T72_16340 [Thermoanaerobaculia bacterium]